MDLGGDVKGAGKGAKKPGRPARSSRGGTTKGAGKRAKKPRGQAQGSRSGKARGAAKRAARGTAKRGVRSSAKAAARGTTHGSAKAAAKRPQKAANRKAKAPVRKPARPRPERRQPRERGELEALILAGGRGERFWPLSRRGLPKQFLPLTGEKSLLAETWVRLRLRLAPEEIRVVAMEDLRARVLEELPGLPEQNFIGEPVGRNTAPAIAIAAALSWREKVNRLQLVVPADHWIGDAHAFWSTIDAACAVARAPDEPLVTLGIPITRPETGYGYIERGPGRIEAPGAYQVLDFREKPDRETATVYERSGRYFWNSGIFVWRLSAVLAEMALHMPNLHQWLREIVTVRGNPLRLVPQVFRLVEAQSIDYGLLEQSSRVVVVQAGFPWSDLGNWTSWGERRVRDAAGNATHGRVVALDATDCTMYAGEGMVAALGVHDLVVVQAGGITLIIPRERSQEVRRLLDELRMKKEWVEFL